MTKQRAQDIRDFLNLRKDIGGELSLSEVMSMKAIPNSCPTIYELHRNGIIIRAWFREGSCPFGLTTSVTKC